MISTMKKNKARRSRDGVKVDFPMRLLRKISSQEEAECKGPGVGGEMDMAVEIWGREGIRFV